MVLTPKFKRAYRRFVRRNQCLRERIDATLAEMQVDVFSLALGTHKLSGNLFGLLACSCGYDCRIVFTIEPGPANGKEVIVLLDIGTHDEVY
ncbi:MAG: hypothetical protein R2911_03650 [Caldilineaceae bacterium]